MAVSDIIKGKKILIYGAGKIGKITCTVLSELHFPVEGFIDQDLQKQGELVLGRSVYSVEGIKSLFSYDVIVVVAIYAMFDEAEVQNVFAVFTEKYGLDIGKNMYHYEEFLANLIQELPMGECFKAMYKAYYGEGLPLEDCSFTRESSFYGINTTEERDKKIILSLTSFPARYKTLHYCIMSLLNQSHKPDKIILNIAEDEANISGEMFTQLTKYGLEIKIVPGNIKQHKKYFYVMGEYPHDIIITVDDDRIYHKDLVRNLVRSYHSNPLCISAAFVLKVSMCGDSIAPISDYEICKEPIEPSLSLMSGGGGGVLYPPNSLHEDALNMDLMLSLCRNSEDMWMKSMGILKGTKVAFASEMADKHSHISIFGSQERSVSKHWIKASGEKQFLLENILRKYNVPLSIFEDDGM